MGDGRIPTTDHGSPFLSGTAWMSISQSLHGCFLLPYTLRTGEDACATARLHWKDASSLHTRGERLKRTPFRKGAPWCPHWDERKRERCRPCRKLRGTTGGTRGRGRPLPYAAACSSALQAIVGASLGLPFLAATGA